MAEKPGETGRQGEGPALGYEPNMQRLRLVNRRRPIKYTVRLWKDVERLIKKEMNFWKKLTGSALESCQ